MYNILIWFFMLVTVAFPLIAAPIELQAQLGEVKKKREYPLKHENVAKLDGLISRAVSYVGSMMEIKAAGKAIYYKQLDIDLENKGKINSNYL